MCYVVKYRVYVETTKKIVQGYYNITSTLPGIFLYSLELLFVYYYYISSHEMNELVRQHTHAVLLQARRVRVLLPHFQQRFKNTYNKQTTFSSMFLSTFCVIFLCFGRIDSGSITHKSWKAEFFRYPRSSTPTSPRTMRF